MAAVGSEYVLFNWDGGGERVRLCGNFNNWKEISMNKSASGSFQLAVPLTAPGTYEYKFVVDGQWIHDREKPSTSDNCGGFNNIITVVPSSQLGEPTGFVPAESYQDFENDSDDDSDTESVCSTLSAASSTGGEPSIKLFIKHSPFVKKEQLKEHFTKQGYGGNVTSINVFFDKATRKPRGYSTISLTPALLADDFILKLNGSLLFGKHKLIVQRERRKRQQKGRKRSDQQRPASSPTEEVKLHVRKLPADVNDSHLRKHFKGYESRILDAFVVKDKQTKQSKGYGFVKFSSRAAAESAIRKLNGSLLHGKHNINVSFAREPPTSKSESQVSPPVQGQLPVSSGLLEVDVPTRASGLAPQPIQSFKPPQSGYPQHDPTCVMIENIQPDVIDEAEVKALIGMPITSFKPCKDAHQILIQLVSSSDAAKAAAVLNGKSILGRVIHAFTCHSSVEANIAPTHAGPLLHSPSHLPHYVGPTMGGPRPLPPQCYPQSPPPLPYQVGVGPSPPYQMHPPGQRPPVMPPPPSQWSPPVNPMIPECASPSVQPPYGPPPPYSESVPNPALTSESFTVKVTRLSPAVTVEMLHDLFSQMGELSCNPKIQESKNRYAYVNYKFRKGAENAVAKLHGIKLHGWEINVKHSESRKGRNVTLSSPPTGAIPSGSAAYPPMATSPSDSSEMRTVKVSNVPPGIQEEQLRQIFQVHGEIHSCNVIFSKKSEPPFAYVNYVSAKGAEMAVAQLHNSDLLRRRIQVKIVPNKQTSQLQTSSTSKTPLDFGSVSQSPSKHGAQEEKIMKLQPEQWNRLTSVGPHGGNKFQEIKAPFESNPNVTIQLQIENTSVRFTGVKDAVESAYCHFASHLNKELHLADRMQMEALVHLYPSMPANISRNHGVTITGYVSGSGTIKFEGPSAKIEEARKEFESITSHWLLKPTDIAVSPTLLASANTRFQNERVLVHLAFQSPTSPNLIVCSFAEQEQAKAIDILRNGLVRKFVNTPSLAVVEQIASDEHCSFRKLEEEHLVAISTDSQQRERVLIHGYVQSDVNAVYKKLVSLVKQLSVKQVCVSCTTGQAGYIKHLLLESKGEGKSLLSSLPAKVFVKGDSIFVSGHPDAITNTKELIETILAEVHCQLFTYQCDPKFVSQIQSSFLFPLKAKNLEFSWHTTVGEPGKGKGRGDRSGGFSILIFSKDPVAFSEIQTALEAIKPRSQRFSLPRREAVDVVKKIKTELEMKYHVRIIEQGSSLVIHGLIPDEIQQCWDEISDNITSTVKIVKHIPVNSAQLNYLKRKQDKEIAELRKECIKLEFRPPRGESDSAAVRVQGTIKQVEVAEEKLLDMISSELDVEKFSVTCEAKFFGMWVRWWNEYRKKQESQCDLLIDFKKRDDQSPNTIVVDFEVCGTDVGEVQEVKETIQQMETAEKCLTVSKASGKAILDGFREKKLDFLQQLPVRVDVEKPSLCKVTITSPQDATADLDSAADGIENFIGDHASVNKVITSEDPVVGLILSSRHHSVKHLSTANSIAKPHHVSVYPLKKPLVGIRLTGSQSAIQIVEPLIRTSVMVPIEQSIAQLPPMKVKHVYGAVLSTPDFVRFETKLRDDFCVTLSYPKLGVQSKAIRSEVIQPSPTARCVSFEICTGSIVFENVDAIANAANEELKHIGGLAKAIADAGGPAIQAESDTYIRRHKKLKPGEAVCLGAGKLPCKKVIHAVGPRWNGGGSMEEQTLYFAVYNCLQHADKEKLGSIALPAIGTGVFSVPEDICARASMKAVRDFCQANPDSSVHTIRFVLFRKNEVDSFVSLFDSEFFSGHKTSKPASPKPSKHTDTYTWSWTDDRGHFVSYQSNVSHTLTREYKRNPTGSVQLTINGQQYVLSFLSMTQTNVSTSHQRKIRYEEGISRSAVSSVQWMWRDDNGSMTAYSASDVQAIESMYKSKSPQNLVIHGKTYTFDFTSMCQVNINTGYKRKIDRQVAEQDQPPLPDLKLPQVPLEEQAVTPPQKDLVFVLRGPPESLPIAKTKLEEKLKASFKEKDITLPSSLTPALEKKLALIAKKYSVSFKFVEGKKGDKRLVLEGLSSNVQHATNNVQEEIIKYQVTLSDSAEQESSCPTEWQPQTRTTEVFVVSQGSAEWSQIEQKFKQTMSGSKIAQISRIQNKWLWDKYVVHKKRLNLKNNGVVNEKELFHGTRQNDPKLIYEGEDGFDMRYSNAGMWGQANYFAVNASYSNSYAYTPGDGSRVMFLVKVLTGESNICSPNSSLRMPPIKPTTSTSGGKVQFSQMRYDTVTGNTGGSQVFMTYDNDKAYPAYLIKYN